MKSGSRGFHARSRIRLRYAFGLRSPFPVQEVQCQRSKERIVRFTFQLLSSVALLPSTFRGAGPQLLRSGSPR